MKTMLLSQTEVFLVTGSIGLYALQTSLDYKESFQVQALLLGRHKLLCLMHSKMLLLLFDIYALYNNILPPFYNNL